jgi:hypothetical protein
VIDASGELPNGRRFNGVAELQQLVLEKEEKFLDCLSEKLLVYALGRGLEYADQATVTQLRQSLQQNDYHLRGLIIVITGIAIVITGIAIVITGALAGREDHPLGRRGRSTATLDVLSPPLSTRRC